MSILGTSEKVKNVPIFFLQPLLIKRTKTIPRNCFTQKTHLWRTIYIPGSYVPFWVIWCWSKSNFFHPKKLLNWPFLGISWYCISLCMGKNRCVCFPCNTIMPSTAVVFQFLEDFIHQWCQPKLKRSFVFLLSRCHGKQECLVGQDLVANLSTCGNGCGVDHTNVLLITYICVKGNGAGIKMNRSNDQILQIKCLVVCVLFSLQRSCADICVHRILASDLKRLACKINMQLHGFSCEQPFSNASTWAEFCGKNWIVIAHNQSTLSLWYTCRKLHLFLFHIL